jgi:CheY-like chemotaxis protein
LVDIREQAQTLDRAGFHNLRRLGGSWESILYEAFAPDAEEIRFGGALPSQTSMLGDNLPLYGKWGVHPIPGRLNPTILFVIRQLSVNSTKPPILLVEDSDEDEYFMRRALKGAGLQNAIFRVSDGQQAIDYLAGEGAYTNRSAYPLPCLILLDLQLPTFSGFDVLEWIHSRREFHGFIVIVLTISDRPQDVSLAYKMGARSYLVKPPTTQQLRELVASLKTCWIGYGPFPPLMLLGQEDS